MRDFRKERIAATGLFSKARFGAIFGAPQSYVADSVDDVVQNRDYLKATPWYAFFSLASQYEGKAGVVVLNARLGNYQFVDSGALKSEAAMKRAEFEANHRSRIMFEETDLDDEKYDTGDLNRDILKVDLELARSLENATLYDGNSMLRVHCPMLIKNGSRFSDVLLVYDPRVDLFTVDDFSREGHRYYPGQFERRVERLVP